MKHLTATAFIKSSFTTCLGWFASVSIRRCQAPAPALKPAKSLCCVKRRKITSADFSSALANQTKSRRRAALSKTQKPSCRSMIFVCRRCAIQIFSELQRANQKIWIPIAPPKKENCRVNRLQELFSFRRKRSRKSSEEGRYYKVTKKY